jgi:gliding motility-associated-like protein
VVLSRIGNSGNYTASVSSSAISVQQKATLSDSHASFTVNNIAATSGTPTTVALNTTGTTVITTVVTAEDGVTTRTYTIAVSKAASLNTLALHTFDAGYNSIAIAPKSNDLNHSDAIIVHQALSPNGDGINDYLTIDGIENYTDNHLSIMNSGGGLVYDVRNYGVNGKVFDGHSNKGGNLQKSGTYYYSLEYKDGNETKRKTGYIILKY